MSNPAMPNLPGFGAIAETMEMVRNMWGSTTSPGIGIPGMVMPTLSVDEINKQISDLKAVESWLTLNMNMLRGTIQALEVQSATISTLRTMGETFSAAVKTATPAAPATPAPSAFSFPFGAAATPAPTAPAPAEPKMPSKVPDPEPPEPAATAAADAPDTKATARKPADGDATADAPLANPAAWWNMLQDQFKHAVSTAIGPEAATGATRPGVQSGTAAPGKKPVAKSKKTVGKAVKKPAAKS